METRLQTRTLPSQPAQAQPEWQLSSVDMATHGPPSIQTSRYQMLGSTVKQLEFSDPDDFDDDAAGMGRRPSSAAGLALDDRASNGRTKLGPSGGGGDGDHNSRIAFIPPPPWVPNQNQPACARCELEFTFYRRRHHCRLCGHIFCDDCSPYKTPIPAFGWVSPVRVCRTCVEAYTGEEIVSGGVIRQRRPSRRNSIDVSILDVTNTSFVTADTAYTVESRHASGVADGGPTVRKILFPQSPQNSIPSSGLWVPDELVVQCWWCTRPFTMTRRRHHCRGCGKVSHCDCTTWRGMCALYATAYCSISACFTRISVHGGRGLGRHGRRGSEVRTDMFD